MPLSVLKYRINRDAFVRPVAQSFAPPGTVVSFVLEGGCPSLYVIGNPEHAGLGRTAHLRCVWTGDPIEPTWKYLGTARMPGDGGGPPLVYHVFEVPPP